MAGAVLENLKACEEKDKRLKKRSISTSDAVVLRDTDSFRIDAVPVSYGNTMDLKTVCYI